MLIKFIIQSFIRHRSFQKHLAPFFVILVLVESKHKLLFLAIFLLECNFIVSKVYNLLDAVISKMSFNTLFKF
jgi:hypothetical protein